MLREEFALLLARGARIATVACAVTIVTLSSTAAMAQSLATYQLTPGWATFGLALAKGEATGAVKVGDLPTQTDVKTTWPDGSIRFAVVTARVVSAGAYNITPSTAATGTFTPPAVSTAVRLTIGGQAWTATLPSALPDRWLSGSQVTEGRAVVAPEKSGVGHPFLRVRYDVRSYATGGSRVDVSVENMLDIAATNAVDYDVAIDVNGATVFTQSAVRHYSFTRWRKVFVTGGLLESAVTTDFAPFIRAKAVPQYMSTVNSGTYPDLSGPEFGILRNGSLLPYFNAAGTRPEISPYPNWTAEFLVHQTPNQRAFVLKHGELAGSWGAHITTDGTRIISLDERPEYWFDPRGPTGNRPANDLAGRPASYGISEPDNAHQPSLAYIPYLVTGDRYFADEMRYWASYCVLRLWPGGGRWGLGLLWPDEVRGRGWALRNMADAAAYLPDADEFRPYFQRIVQRNLDDFDAYATQTEAEAGPLQAIFKYNGFIDAPPYWSRSIWEEYQFIWAVDHATAHGDYRAGSGEAIRDRLVQFCMRTLTSEEFPREWGGPYKLALGTYRDGNYTYFQTLAEALTGTKAITGPVATPLVGDWYGVQVRFMTMLAIRERLPRAQESYDWLMGVTQGGESMTDTLRRRAGWAIAALPSAPSNVRITSQ